MANQGIPHTFFGNQLGAIRIQFNKGASVVKGYIVDQVGGNAFRVMEDGGTATYIVQLAQTTFAALNLSSLKATITITPFGQPIEHIKAIQTGVCYTTEGNVYFWNNVAASQTGYGEISNIKTITDIQVSTPTIVSTTPPVYTIISALDSVPSGASLVLTNDSSGSFIIVDNNILTKKIIDGTQNYSITMLATSGSATFSKTVSITGNGVAAPVAPIITSASTFSFSEGQTGSAFALTADQSVTWSIVGGADQSSFSINGQNLVVSAIQSYSGTLSNARTVIVQATSVGTGLTTNMTLIGTVTQVTSITITSPSSFSFPEGNQSSVSLTASAACTWSITGGTDAAQFSISDQTLNISSQTWSGTLTNNRVVNVLATAITGGATASQTITGTVTFIAAPTVTTAPVISNQTGGAWEKSILQVTTGVYAGSVTSVTRKWRYTTGSVDISGAIGLKYTRAFGDIATGSQIELLETIVGQGGTITSVSNTLPATISGRIFAAGIRATDAFVNDPDQWGHLLGNVDHTSDGFLAGNGSGGTYANIRFFGKVIGTAQDRTGSWPKMLNGFTAASGGSGCVVAKVPTNTNVLVRAAIGGDGIGATMSAVLTTTDWSASHTPAVSTLANTAIANGQLVNFSAVADTAQIITSFSVWEGTAAWFPVTTTSTGFLSIAKNQAASGSVDIRAFEVIYPEYNQVTSGTGPYYIDNAVGDDVTGDGSIAKPWKHIPGDPAAGGNVGAFTVLPGGVINLQGGQHHRPASYTGRNNQHIQFPSAGVPGNPITYQSYGTGQAIIDGSEILTGWASATSGDVSANPNVANIKKLAVTGVTSQTFPNVICEGETYLAPAQWPSPACPYDYGRLVAGTDAFFVVPPANYAREVVTGSANSYSAGFMACTIISDTRTGNLKDHYGSIDITGASIVTWMIPNLITEFVIDSYDTATGTIHFHIPNATPGTGGALEPSTDGGGWFGYAIRYHPFDIAQAGQFAYSTDRSTVFANFFGSSERSIVRLSYGTTYDHDYITFNGLTFERFGVVNGAAIVNTFSSVVRSGLVLNNFKSRHIFNSTRGAAVQLDDSMTTLSITNLDTAESGIAVSGLFLAPAVANTLPITVTNVRQRTSGRSTPYFAGKLTNVTALDIDVCDYDDMHGNGPTIYQGANNIEIGRFYSMNRPRPVSIQTDGSQPGTRSNHLHHFVTSTRMPDPNAQWSPANYAWQGFNGETSSLYEFGIIGGLQSYAAGGSNGLVQRNMFINGVSATDLTGITFQNCLIGKGHNGLTISSAAAMQAAGATVINCTYDLSGNEWDGTITLAIQEMITRNTGGSGYIQVNLGHSAYPWIIPAYGSSFSLLSTYMTTTSIRANHKANDTFASIICTQPGSSISLPAGVTDNNLFALWNGRVYSLATLPANTYHITVRQTSSNPNLTGPSTLDTVHTLTVA
jgi:hypothetical protein